MQTSGAVRRENAKLYQRHCEPPGRREAPPDDRLREAIHSIFTPQHGLLRCARNDDANCRHPRRRVTQYSRDVSDGIDSRCVLDTALAGYDSVVCGAPAPATA